MRKASYTIVKVIAILVSVAILLFGFWQLIQFKTVKETYEANVAAHSSIAASQVTAINENNSAIIKADAAAKQNDKALAQIQTQLSSAKSKLSKLTNSDDRKVCYLTFDDGPSENTLKILKTLKDKNAKATFFVTGVGDTKYMKNIVESGNAIALHTYCHEYDQIYSSVDAYFKDLNKIHDLVQKETGIDCKIIRFPGGSSNTISRSYSSGIMSTLAKKVQDQGYQYFDWNCDSTDASDNNVAVSKLIANTNAEARGMKSITVLMHDTAAKDTTAEALPTIIDNLREMGFEFEELTVDTPAVHHGINN